MQNVVEESRPSLGSLLKIWLQIAFEAFGGGASANLLIREAFVEKHQWISEDAYLRYRDLSVVAPGSNLLSLVILIGRKLRGGPGVAVSLVGMVLPGVVVTMAFTIGFSLIQHTIVMQAILNGLIPATAGTALYQAVRFSWPLLKHERYVSMIGVILCLAVILIDTLAIILFKAPAVLIVLASAALGTLIFRSGPIHMDDQEKKGEMLKADALEENSGSLLGMLRGKVRGERDRVVK
ncbi:MAG TPA: chromate transporter [Ktedonobacteraceae bacterium]|nr:chromate transporter [Ktedonobacteraceae bacterium]